jgi:hypothetical protein
MSNDTDQTIDCRDCRIPFVFTAGEQKFFAERQFTPPTRCKGCRQIRKQAKEAGESGGTFNPSGGFSSGGYQQATTSAGGETGDGRRGGGGGRRRGGGGQGSYGD